MKSKAVKDATRIVADPRIRFGKPTIRGTRIAVEDVLRLASRGSTADILAEYPGLSEEDVRAAHEFAADYLRDAFVQQPEAVE